MPSTAATKPNAQWKRRQDNETTQIHTRNEGKKTAAHTQFVSVPRCTCTHRREEKNHMDLQNYI